jgi:hypothetical protein
MPKAEHSTSVVLCPVSEAAMVYLTASTGLSQSRLLRVLLIAAGSGQLRIPGLPKIPGDKAVAERFASMVKTGVGTV